MPTVKSKDPKELLYSQNPIAWVIGNNFVTENDKPLEWSSHRFLIEPFADMHPFITCMKSAQVGFSVAAILKSFWLAKYKKFNTGYVLPTNNVVKDFVTPKVDPLISKNAAVADLVSKDSVALKQIGDRFVYYRGSTSDRQAISISLDVLVVDEKDRCMDQGVLTTYESRLQAPDSAGWQWEFSNPSVPNFGVHQSWLESDQRHWFVTCTHCGHKSYLTYDKDETYNTHYVDENKESYACGACGEEITDDARQDGDWIAKFPDKYKHGYWISQLMVPWVSAQYVIGRKRNTTPEFFYNFVLGLPYLAADIALNRETITRACSPMKLAYTNVCIGVDNGIEKHVIIGTPNGIFRYLKTESWEEIEQLFLQYNATMVIDANPYPAVPKKLVEKYPGRVFINYYVPDKNDIEIIRFQEGKKRGVVHADRTKVIDQVVREISDQQIMFAFPHQEMEEYIYHAENMYRVVETNSHGVDKGKWITKEGKPDHYFHATVYWRIAVAKIFAAGTSGIAKPAGAVTAAKQLHADPVTHEVAFEHDLEKLAKDQERINRRDWRY